MILHAVLGDLRGSRPDMALFFSKITGEEGSVSDKMMSEWKTDKLLLLVEFSPNDIFNTDKTGLFWKCFPDKTLSMKGKCTGGKRSKETITVLVSANMPGNEKMPLLVIRKFAKPRCFKNAKSIPVQYEANRKARMVTDLFSSWLTKLDSKFHCGNRKIAMVVDNYPAHLNIQSKLKAIKLILISKYHIKESTL